MWGKNDIIGKIKGNIPAKDKWKLTTIIPLMLIVGFNNCLPILNLSKIMEHIYITENTIHQFAIGYMINPSLHFNKVFREKVQKCLGCSFPIKKMKTIKNCLMKKNNYTKF